MIILIESRCRGFVFCVTHTHTPLQQQDMNHEETQRIVYVAAYSSGAGKSTVCASLLQYLLTEEGIPPESLAYIKPVTQCEAETPVAELCAAKGIPSVPIGPVVFRQGVTNDVIGAEDFIQRRRDLLQRAVDAVVDLSTGRRVTVVDGVGYPTVGSCAGVGGGDVAAGLQGRHSSRAPGAAPVVSVVLVAPGGLGDALDTVELMLQYFVSKGCRVAGVIFNKVRDTPRHKLAVVEPLIRKYMTELHPSVAVLGFVPLHENEDGKGDASGIAHATTHIAWKSLLS